MRERIVDELRDAPDLVFAIALLGLAVLLGALSAALHAQLIPLGVWD